jgi:hypothetical protein
MTVRRFPGHRYMISGDLGIPSPPPSEAWIEDSLRWRGKVLTGEYGHWCEDWDYLPIDETCPEWPCPCSMSNGIE